MSARPLSQACHFDGFVDEPLLLEGDVFVGALDAEDPPDVFVEPCDSTMPGSGAGTVTGVGAGVEVDVDGAGDAVGVTVGAGTMTVAAARGEPGLSERAAALVHAIAVATAIVATEVAPPPMAIALRVSTGVSSRAWLPSPHPLNRALPT